MAAKPVFFIKIKFEILFENHYHYCSAEAKVADWGNSPGGARFPSGQRGRTVNPLAQPSQVRILLSPPVISKEMAGRPIRLAVWQAGIAQLVERQPSKL